jgi:pimeloyl-ACP methyl ester carboxylesterase/lysophospholipase L1-like esterase
MATLLTALALAISLPAITIAEEWQGRNKIDFQIQGRKAFLVEPTKPAAGKPWIWRTEFFGHEPQADIALLDKGFFLAYVDMTNLYGGPLAMSIMDEMYLTAIGKHSLSEKVVLEGFSRGGLFAFNWAARNPAKVACIYNDAPVCDFTSWPGGKGQGKGSPADWERLKKVYAMRDEEAANSPWNPINQLETIAKAKIPLLHVCGATDDAVPIAENSLIVQKQMVALGGSFTLISKPNCNHHPHSLKDPTRIVNFILTHTGLADQVTDALTPFGYDYFQLRGGLYRSFAKFEIEKVGRVAFLGGSITQSKGWRDLVCEDLQKRFPRTKFDFIAAGISSLGSTPGAFRFQRDVLANGPVDLLFEEAAVNDDTNGFSDIEQIRGMEGIVRHALRSNPKMDVVLLHFVDPGKMNEIRAGKTPAVIANHEKVADRYGIPSIDLAREVTDRIDAGEFTWDKDFKGLHPAPFGHELYARSIGRLLNHAWKEGPTNVNVPARELPPPVDSASYFFGRLVGAAEAVDSGKAKLVKGWSLANPWTPADKAGTRPGFVQCPALIAEESGATMQYSFSGTGIGLFIAAGPDTGNIEYRIDQGDWRTQELFTEWSSGLHLPWAKMLASELPDGEHQLELRVSPTSDSRSKGHAIRIIHFLVNAPE